MIPIKIMCQICGFDISKFGRKYTKSRICKMCEKKSVNRFEEQLTTSYEEELSKFCPDGLILNNDRYKSSQQPAKPKPKPKIKKPMSATEAEEPKIKINLGFSINMAEILEMDDDL